MRVDLLRSKPGLDRTGESSEFSLFSGIRGAVNDGEHLHVQIVFPEYAGDTPHAHVSMTWADIEAAISTFAAEGLPQALSLHRAAKLATALDEFLTVGGWSTSNKERS